MKRKLGYLIAVGFALAMAGCATQGGGQIDPIASEFVPKTLYDFGPTLELDATGACNVGAAKEYDFNMEVCANPTSWISQIPGQPFVTPAQMAEIIGAVCGADGYNTPGMPTTVTPGNCTAQVPVRPTYSIRG